MPVLVTAMAVSQLAFSARSAEPNPPKWPKSVAVFGPGDTGTEEVIAAAYAVNGGHVPANHGQFSSKRFAFLFKPGSYDVNVPVGYYTQVLGLGAAPSDVTFTSPRGVYSEEQDYTITGALDTFWRSAENFRTLASEDWQVGKGMMWAVSQAAPLRRVDVANDLLLYEYQPPIPAAGEASGGFMANIRVGAGVHRVARPHTYSAAAATTNSSSQNRPGEGSGFGGGSGGGGSRLRATSGVQPGSQQQWFSRDCTLSSWAGGVWNVVFSGVEGAPPSHCGNVQEDNPGSAAADGAATGQGASPVTTLSATPAVAEKPYVTIDASGRYQLRIPPVQRGTRGARFLDADNGTRVVDFSEVYVTQPTDSASAINAKLAEGKHIVFSPAVYGIEEALVVKHAGQVRQRRARVRACTCTPRCLPCTSPTLSRVLPPACERPRASSPPPNLPLPPPILFPSPSSPIPYDPTYQT